MQLRQNFRLFCRRVRAGGKLSISSQDLLRITYFTSSSASPCRNSTTPVLYPQPGPCRSERETQTLSQVSRTAIARKLIASSLYSSLRRYNHVTDSIKIRKKKHLAREHAGPQIPNENTASLKYLSPGDVCGLPPRDAHRCLLIEDQGFHEGEKLMTSW